MHSLLTQPAHPGAHRHAQVSARLAVSQAQGVVSWSQGPAVSRAQGAVSWAQAPCRSALAVVSQAMPLAWLSCCKPVSRYSPMPQASFWPRYKFCIATRLLPTLLLHCHNTPECIAIHSTPVLKPFSHDTNYCIVTPYPSPASLPAACNTIFVLQHIFQQPLLPFGHDTKYCILTQPTSPYGHNTIQPSVTIH